MNIESNYGPYAFGVVALCVLLGALASLWKVVFFPVTVTLSEISRNNALTTNNLRDTAAILERCLTDSKNMNNQQASMLTRLEALEKQEHN